MERMVQIMNGGYAMVDCTGLDLEDLGTVSGLYEQVKNAVNTGKPIVLNNVVNGDQRFSPMVAYGGEESTTSVFLSFFPVTIHISNQDVVTM